MVEKKFMKDYTGKIDEKGIIYLDRPIGRELIYTMNDAIEILKQNPECRAICVSTNSSGHEREYYITPGMTFENVKEKYLAPENEVYKKLVLESAAESEKAPENAEIDEIKAKEDEIARQIKELMEKKNALSSKRSGLNDKINQRERARISQGMSEYYDGHAKNNEKLLNELANASSEEQSEPNA